MEPTITDPELRTYSGKLANFAMDHTPWRAPGFAPVYDSCGIASGVPAGVDPGPINPTPSGVKQGMSMQKLPQASGAKEQWPAGSTQEVSWRVDANHGGGYAYRLCPKNGSELTESCFQQHHLQFVGNQSWIQFGNNTKNRSAIPATRTSKGTNPAGSQWTKNPIPACGGLTGGFLHGSQCRTAQFKPPLADVIAGHPKYAPLDGLYGLGPHGHCIPGPTGWCSSDERKFWKERFNFDIIDVVQIPEDLSAGEYLLSWRWDSEQTPQVWTQCADVTITDAHAVVV